MSTDAASRPRKNVHSVSSVITSEKIARPLQLRSSSCVQPKEDCMSNIEAVVESYVASWNETDPGRRQSALAAACAADASYRDPVMASDGHAGLDAMLAGVQAKFRASC